MLKITEYAEKLLDGLDDLDWPEAIKQMQKNWIGKSCGAEAVFTLLDGNGKPCAERITVYTTRPDTIFGASYVVLAPEHSLVKKISTPAQEETVKAYVEAAAKKKRP